MNKEHKYKDKDEYKDNYKDKDADRITESLTVCYIFGILVTQAFPRHPLTPPPSLGGHSKSFHLKKKFTQKNFTPKICYQKKFDPKNFHRKIFQPKNLHK